MRAAARWAGVALYAVGIFALSGIPAGPTFRVPLAAADKVLHFLLFFFFAALLYRALPGSGPPRWRAALAAALIASLYGVTDEIHQAFVPGRTASGWDWLADAAGAFLLPVWLLLAAGRKATWPGRSGGPEVGRIPCT